MVLEMCNSCKTEFEEIIKYKAKKYCYDCLLHKLTNGKNKIDTELAIQEIQQIYTEQKNREKERKTQDDFWFYIQSEYDIPKLSSRVFQIMHDMIAFGVKYDIMLEMFKNSKVKLLMEKSTQNKDFESQESKFLFHLQVVSGKYHKYKTERDRFLNREKVAMTVSDVLKNAKLIQFPKRDKAEQIEEKYRYQDILF